MDYKKKYIKYKSKYINLKNNFLSGGHYNKCLKELNKQIDKRKNILIIDFIAETIKDKLVIPKGLVNNIDDIYKLITKEKISLEEDINTPEKFMNKYKEDILEFIDSDVEYKILDKINFINLIFIDLIRKSEGFNKNLDMKIIKNIINIYSEKDNIIFNKIKKYYNEIKEFKTISKKDNYMFVVNNSKPILFFLQIMKSYSYSFNDSYIIGDSCAKFKYMYDILIPNNNIDIIYFSGKMYKKEDEEDEEYIRLMNENCLKYYENNKLVMEKIFYNLSLTISKKIILYDFIGSGESLLTFIELLILINNNKFHLSNFKNIIKEKILFVLFTNFKNTKIINTLPDDINYIIIGLQIDYNDFSTFLNSDNFLGESKICSRCIPSYKVDKWKYIPGDIYIDDIDGPNYIGCNLNKLYLYLFLICCLGNIINPTFDMIDTNDINCWINGDYNLFSSYIKNLDLDKKLYLEDEDIDNLYEIRVKA